MNMGGGGGGGGGDGHDMGMTMPQPPSSAANGSTSMHGGGMGTMHMTFFWGHRVDVLFSGWPGAHRHGAGMYLLALLLVFALSALVEFLSYLPRLAALGGGGGGGGGLVLTGIATLRTGLSYLVMLAVMSFNAGVLLAAVLGHALGYYVFGSGAVLGRGPRKEQAPAPAPEEEILQHKC